MRLILLLSFTFTALLRAADPAALVVVSSADYHSGIAPGSLATIFGTEISRQTLSADTMPWPTRLGDIPVVRIVDSAQHTTEAGILAISPTQMNIWIPPDVALGPATIAFPVTNVPPGVTAALRVMPVTIQKSAPAIFSADGSGTGAAAASAVRVVLPTNIASPVPVFTCSPTCQPVPIDPGLDAPVYLSFYGTGLRNATSVTASIGGVSVPVLFAGPQPQVPGLDQVNVPLILSLRGRGVVDVLITADGVASNPVQIRVQ